MSALTDEIWNIFAVVFMGLSFGFSSVYQMKHIFLLIVRNVHSIFENAFMIYCYSLRFASFSSVTKDWLVAKHLNLSRLQTIAVFSLYFAVLWIQIDQIDFWAPHCAMMAFFHSILVIEMISVSDQIFTLNGSFVWNELKFVQLIQL